MDKDPSEALEQFAADQVREAAGSVDSGVHVISVGSGSERARRRTMPASSMKRPSA